MNTAPTDELAYDRGYADGEKAIRAEGIAADEYRLRNGAHALRLIACDYYDAGRLTEAARVLGTANAYRDALANI
jgi:hypothetical protein